MLQQYVRFPNNLFLNKIQIDLIVLSLQRVTIKTLHKIHAKVVLHKQKWDLGKLSSFVLFWLCSTHHSKVNLTESRAVSHDNYLIDYSIVSKSLFFCLLSDLSGLEFDN